MIHTTASSDVLVRCEEFEVRSQGEDAAGRLFRNKAAVVSLVILAVMATLAVFAPLLSPHDHDEIYWDRMQQPPDFANAHWLGTDGVGRDMFVRILYGARVSLAVGLLATAVSLVIGVTYGAVAGFLGGRSEERRVGKEGVSTCGSRGSPGY